MFLLSTPPAHISNLIITPSPSSTLASNSYCYSRPSNSLVLMVLDDVGWCDVGYHGSDFATPNIDRLAAGGVRLERYYVQEVCSPTRSSLMTGRLPLHTGFQTVLQPGGTQKLPLDVSTLPEALQKVGYRNYAIGKWHLGYSSWNYTPLGRGFDSFAGYLQGQSDYNMHTNTVLGTQDPEGKQGFDFWRNKSGTEICKVHGLLYGSQKSYFCCC